MKIPASHCIVVSPSHNQTSVAPPGVESPGEPNFNPSWSPSILVSGFDRLFLFAVTHEVDRGRKRLWVCGNARAGGHAGHSHRACPLSNLIGLRFNGFAGLGKPRYPEGISPRECGGYNIEPQAPKGKGNPLLRLRFNSKRVNAESNLAGKAGKRAKGVAGFPGVWYLMAIRKTRIHAGSGRNSASVHMIFNSE